MAHAGLRVRVNTQVEARVSGRRADQASCVWSGLRLRATDLFGCGSYTSGLGRCGSQAWFVDPSPSPESRWLSFSFTYLFFGNCSFSQFLLRTATVTLPLNCYNHYTLIPCLDVYSKF